MADPATAPRGIPQKVRNNMIRTLCDRIFKTKRRIDQAKDVLHLLNEEHPSVKIDISVFSSDTEPLKKLDLWCPFTLQTDADADLRLVKKLIQNDLDNCKKDIEIMKVDLCEEVKRYV